MGFPALGFYRQRRPRSSGLWQALDAGFDAFQAEYEDRYETKYGPLRPVVIKRVQEYLKCRFPDPGGKWVGAFSRQARV